MSCLVKQLRVNATASSGGGGLSGGVRGGCREASTPDDLDAAPRESRNCRDTAESWRIALGDLQREAQSQLFKSCWSSVLVTRRAQWAGQRGRQKPEQANVDCFGHGRSTCTLSPPRFISSPSPQRRLPPSSSLLRMHALDFFVNAFRVLCQQTGRRLGDLLHCEGSCLLALSQDGPLMFLTSSVGYTEDDVIVIGRRRCAAWVLHFLLPPLLSPLLSPKFLPGAVSSVTWPACRRPRSHWVRTLPMVETFSVAGNPSHCSVPSRVGRRSVRRSPADAQR